MYSILIFRSFLNLSYIFLTWTINCQLNRKTGYSLKVLLVRFFFYFFLFYFAFSFGFFFISFFSFRNFSHSSVVQPLHFFASVEIFHYFYLSYLLWDFMMNSIQSRWKVFLTPTKCRYQIEFRSSFWKVWKVCKSMQKRLKSSGVLNSNRLISQRCQKNVWWMTFYLDILINGMWLNEQKYIRITHTVRADNFIDEKENKQKNKSTTLFWPVAFCRSHRSTIRCCFSSIPRTFLLFAV